ncbi:hypothetical protein AB6724_07150 [Comamonas guangdongensis]|uniref:UDP-3-O-(3-hydroxymyristoyl)glucosamine N-acyltransferase n=2 Tax=Comamonas guangdongensis TaxID=510515 RepID=A0ABV3ZST4_9BURK
MASTIAGWCGVNWLGTDMQVHSIAPLSAPTDGALCFANSAPLQTSASQVALISTAEAQNVASCLLATDRPRLTFAKALDAIQRNIGFQRPTVPPQIDPTAQVSPQAFVAPGVVIGARTIVLPFSYIGEGTIIGEDCIIKSGAVIGQDGFGFERDENNIPLRIVHLGNVIIGNNVEVGCVTTVCRGTLGNTIIEDSVKIDDHVHIAHNVVVGVGAMVIACAEVSGGVKIGAGAWVGPNSSIIQKVTIGENSLVGIAANVTKNVPDGVVVAGNPAKTLRSNN